MITVMVKAFGSLARGLGDLAIGEAEAVEVRPGATLAELAEQLALPGAKAFFVNGVGQKKEYGLQDQDEVAVMPLVGGG